MGDQGKYWCFTNFELTVDYHQWGYSYLCYGVERCPKTDRIHHQGYVEFPTNKRIAALKKLCNSIHWEKRKGTCQEAVHYCGKDGAFHEFGEKSDNKQGKRTDLELVKDAVKDGKGMKEIISLCNSFQAVRFAEKLIEHNEKKRDWEPRVMWYWGPTGTGKTRRAIEEAGADYWISGRNLKWWQGYDAHENVIIDDFRGDFCTLHELLRILDRYPYTIEVKGASRQLLAKNIWITCPYHPMGVYKTSENINQLLRRITEVIYFPGDPENSGIGIGMEVGGNTSPKLRLGLPPTSDPGPSLENPGVLDMQIINYQN